MNAAVIATIGACLVSSSATPGLAKVMWSKDGRSVLVELSAIAGSDSSAQASVVDLASGKTTSSWSTGRYGCEDHDAACAAKNESERKAEAARIKEWTASHGGASDARWEFSSHAGSSTVTFNGRTASLASPKRTIEIDGDFDAVHCRVSWSPDDQWALLVVDADQPDQRFVIAPGIARVDLLDAGAGASSLDVAAAKLKTAGFVLAHTGKSQSAHAKAEIFYAVGFEADAKQIAGALGLDASAAQPVTWSTPFAITVALAVAIAKSAP